VGVGCREWSAQQEALRLITPIFLELKKLSKFLDSFCNHLHPERSGHLYYRCYECAVFGAGEHPAYERAIDLEPVDGQLAKPSETGEAGAKVVDCY